MRDERDRRDGQRSSEFWVLSSELEADKKGGTGERGYGIRDASNEMRALNPGSRIPDRASRIPYLELQAAPVVLFPPVPPVARGLSG